MCLLSSVEFLCFVCRNDAVWFLYLVLNSFSVSPIYASMVLLSLRVAGWYAAYQKSLDESGYQYTLCYEPATTTKRKNRPRNNVLWYNPPFSKNVSTDIGHKFISLIDKHFPRDHKLRKKINRNTIKISYSCMNNTKQNIDSHNKNILKSSERIHDTPNSTKDNKTCFSVMDG